MADLIVVDDDVALSGMLADYLSIAGHEVAFMARHGVRHDYQPHRVPYRANVWAMHAIGVRSVIAPCSVGSLQPDIHPEQLVGSIIGLWRRFF